MHYPVKSLPNLVKGDRVFTVITWDTPSLFSDNFYRPYPYFVLQTEITGTVDFSSGKHYRLQTPYRPKGGYLFRSLEEAKKALAVVFQRETGVELPLEKVKIVSMQEEKEVLDKQSAHFSELARSTVEDGKRL